MAASHRLVWALVVLAWITNYLVRMALPAVLPPIIAELGLSYARAGLLATAGFFWAYAAIQLPAGLVGDRFGRRRVVVWGLLAGAAASALTGLAGAFAMLLAARCATGLAQGCSFSNDRAIIAAVTPRAKIALGQAVSFSGPALGTTLGLLIGGLLGTLLPWRHVFFVVAIPPVVPPVVAALLILRFVPESPRRAAAPLGARVRHVLAQPDLWVLGLTGSAVMWAQYALATWAPLPFVEAGVRDLGRAGFLASLMGVGGVAGLLAGGTLGDRARRRGLGHKVVIAGGLVGAALALAALAVLVGARASPAALLAALLAVSACAWSVWGPFVLGRARDVSGSFAAGYWLSAGVAAGGAVAALAVRPAWRLAPPVPPV